MNYSCLLSNITFDELLTDSMMLSGMGFIESKILENHLTCEKNFCTFIKIYQNILYNCYFYLLFCQLKAFCLTIYTKRIGKFLMF